MDEVVVFSPSNPFKAGSTNSIRKVQRCKLVLSSIRSYTVKRSIYLYCVYIYIVYTEEYTYIMLGVIYGGAEDFYA